MPVTEVSVYGFDGCNAHVQLKMLIVLCNLGKSERKSVENLVRLWVYPWEELVWRVVLGLWTVEWCWHTDGHYRGPTSSLPEEHKIIAESIIIIIITIKF